MQLPPSGADAVKKALQRTQIVVEECEQKYALVTYDLPIAKIAKRIWFEETPQFDDVFIIFGSFHIEMTFFPPLVNIIEGAEGP